MKYRVGTFRLPPPHAHIPLEAYITQKLLAENVLYLFLYFILVTLVFYKEKFFKNKPLDQFPSLFVVSN